MRSLQNGRVSLFHGVTMPTTWLPNPRTLNPRGTSLWQYVYGLVAVMSVWIYAVTAENGFEDVVYTVPYNTPAPDFLPSASNVTFHKGELAVLRCSVYNLGTKTVVWRRYDNSFPLTSGVLTVIADERIQISHVDYKNQWDLMIKNVRPSDEGVYECQVASRDRNFRKLVSLTVLDTEVDTPEIKITGQQYVERGESITLQCNATGEYYPPDEMDWFRNGHRMSSDEVKGIRIAKQFSIAHRTFTSNLKISRASMRDSGTYVCRSSNMQIASTKVHVLNAETFNIKRAGTQKSTAASEDGDNASLKDYDSYSTASSWRCTSWRLVLLAAVLTFQIL